MDEIDGFHFKAQSKGDFPRVQEPCQETESFRSFAVFLERLAALPIAARNLNPDDVRRGHVTRKHRDTALVECPFVTLTMALFPPCSPLLVMFPGRT